MGARLGSEQDGACPAYTGGQVSAAGWPVRGSRLDQLGLVDDALEHLLQPGVQG